ncbi:MAG: hypothetical protein LBU07_04520 [Coriobacteriales bacterium]|nr:hypothetical protein [Coriobacteriales bacterium]
MSAKSVLGPMGLHYATAYNRASAAIGSCDRRLVEAELARRDPEWVRSGTVPKVTYADEKLEVFVTKKYPHQARTANRLSKQGYHFHTIDDTELYTIPGTKQQQRVGLVDGMVAGQGWELKTLLSGEGVTSINTALHISAKKKGLDVIVIDNVESKLTDDEARRYIKSRMGARRIKEVVLLRKDGIDIIKK